MRKTFKEVKGVSVDKPKLVGLMDAGKVMHKAFTSNIPPIAMSSTAVPCSRPIPAPRKKRSFLKAMEEEFANNLKSYEAVPEETKAPGGYTRE